MITFGLETSSKKYCTLFKRSDFGRVPFLRENALVLLSKLGLTGTIRGGDLHVNSDNSPLNYLKRDSFEYTTFKTINPLLFVDYRKSKDDRGEWVSIVYLFGKPAELTSLLNSSPNPTDIR